MNIILGFDIWPQLNWVGSPPLGFSYALRVLGKYGDFGLASEWVVLLRLCQLCPLRISQIEFVSE